MFVYLFLDVLDERSSLDRDSPAFPGHSGRPWSLSWYLWVLVPRCPVFLRHVIGFDIGFGPIVELDAFLVVLVPPDMAGYPRDGAFSNLVSDGLDNIKRAIAGLRCCVPKDLP